MSEENSPGAALEKTYFIFNMNGSAVFDNLCFAFQKPASILEVWKDNSIGCLYVKDGWAPARRFTLRL